MSSPDPQPLSYAPRPKPAARLTRRIVLAMVAIVIATIAWQRGPAVWNRAMLLYWQRQCLNYTATADQVMYDNKVTTPDQDLPPGQRSLTEVYAELEPHAVGHVPKALVELQTRAELRPLDLQECVLFMHGLTSPNGVRRLVIVTCSEFDVPAGYLERAVNTLVVTPTGWKGTPSMVQGMARPDTPHWRGPTPSLKIYAGQVDPKDASHFTIRFRRMEDGIIDGRITDDGQVHLEFLGSKNDGFDKPLE